jgi:hypothetical protein
MGTPSVDCLPNFIDRHAKQTTDKGKPSANIQMAFLLPVEFMAPADQEVYSDFDESEFEKMVAKLTLTQ